MNDTSLWTKTFWVYMSPIRRSAKLSDSLKERTSAWLTFSYDIIYTEKGNLNFILLGNLFSNLFLIFKCLLKECQHLISFKEAYNLYDLLFVKKGFLESSSFSSSSFLVLFDCQVKDWLPLCVAHLTVLYKISTFSFMEIIRIPCLFMCSRNPSIVFLVKFWINLFLDTWTLRCFQGNFNRWYYC